MGEFPTDYQKYRRRAIKAGYPLCHICGEPVQKAYQKKEGGRLCRRCFEQQALERENAWPTTGEDPIAYLGEPA